MVRVELATRLACEPLTWKDEDVSQTPKWSLLRAGAICVLAGLSLVMLAVPNSATAGPLAVDGNAIAGFAGSQNFNANIFPLSFLAIVDFAVYAPGDFNTSFPGQDPSAGTDYVYAYQVFNTGSISPPPGTFVGSIGLFTVGFSGLDELPANPGSFGAGQAPNSETFSEAVPPFSSARYSYVDPGPANFLAPGANSNFLIYTSPFPPEFDSGSLQDNFALVDVQLLPSPIPEPGTILLFAIGALSIMIRARWRS